MAFVVGQREYNPQPGINLRSLSARRAALIKWHHQHPGFSRLYKRADAAVDKSNEKLRQYNETKGRLEKRIARAAGNALPLVASHKRVCNLIVGTKLRIPAQSKERDALADRIYEWENLPALDRQIADAKRQRLR